MPGDIQDLYPGEELLQQIGMGRPYVRLEPVSGGGYRIITAVDIPQRSTLTQPRALLGQFPVVARLGRLADTVDQTYTEYRGLMFLREPLKSSFTLTLTLVLLLSFLGAVYGAFFFANRLVLPIQQLVAGTRAVAKGDFDTQLPPGSSRDEMGFLVNSFNDMTRRLGKAREAAARSQQLVESQRANLAIILARLSTGVISLDDQLRIRTANEAAGAILGTQLGSRVGETLEDVAAGQPLLSQFLKSARSHLDQGDFEWREQFVLRGELGSRILMCACTPLPGGSDQPGGFVLVFDDITALLQAQRDAAWGEVARRLAHEIKNPLTPIQLSAERIRQRYLDKTKDEDSEFLERATHTIVQQVEAIKDMVNAFTEYARAPDLDVSKVNVNQLIGEVLELYRARETGVSISRNLDPDLGEIEVDAGRLRQILHNLIRNSIEALGDDKNGKVEVFSRYHDQDEHPVAEILVRDNGPGFQMDVVSRVFDPYVTSKPKGTGLGLAIVKKLVEEHGGRIDAGNRKDGGAEVRVLLPVNESARHAMMEQRRLEVRRESA
jgi:nitrogen fixation/metabolism regulation signal transduction histidine kinase